MPVVSSAGYEGDGGLVVYTSYQGDALVWRGLCVRHKNPGQPPRDAGHGGLLLVAGRGKIRVPG